MFVLVYSLLIVAVLILLVGLMQFVFGGLM